MHPSPYNFTSFNVDNVAGTKAKSKAARASPGPLPGSYPSQTKAHDSVSPINPSRESAIDVNGPSLSFSLF